ncbi:MAG: hypothetical protein WBH99_07370 [Azovibrio sp.]
MSGDHTTAHLRRRNFLATVRPALTLLAGGCSLTPRIVTQARAS